MPAPTNKGQEMLVGLGALTFTGYFVESMDREPISDVEEIRDENDAVAAKLISNPGHRISGRMMVKGGADLDAELDTRTIGDTITIDDVGYMIESWKVARSRKTATVDFTAVKESSMTYE